MASPPLFAFKLSVSFTTFALTGAIAQRDQLSLQLSQCPPTISDILICDVIAERLSAAGCSNRSSRDRTVKYHRLPKDPKLRRIWPRRNQRFSNPKLSDWSSARYVATTSLTVSEQVPPIVCRWCGVLVWCESRSARAEKSLSDEY